MSTLSTAISPLPEGVQAPVEVTPSVWRGAWMHLVQGRLTRICLAVVAVYVACGVVSLTPILEGKIEDISADSYVAPNFHSLSGLFGTDIQGRSVFWRVIYGTRIALEIAVLASAIAITLGIFLGIVGGYFGGWIDEIITWIFTVVSSVPWILLVLALVYALKGVKFFGRPISELWLVILALGFTDWVGLCRLMRGEVLKHRERDYVQAARAVGAGHFRILLRHILPNTIHIVIINFTLGAIAYVQAEVALTFLGLGISDKPSWGRMIDDAKLELLKGVWWQAVAATVAIGILCLALNILGDALRDALDPRLRGIE